MDFQYSDEQQLLRESVNKYGADTWPAANRHKYLNEGTAWRKSRWAELAEMGWLMLPIPEAQGGLDGQPADVMVVAECIGRHLITSPYITSCVLVPALLAESDCRGWVD
jgi:alkylation response protein AidB-like acyl-CoA dehydrogenase